MGQTFNNVNEVLRYIRHSEEKVYETVRNLGKRANKDFFVDASGVTLQLLEPYYGRTSTSTQTKYLKPVRVILEKLVKTGRLERAVIASFPEKAKSRASHYGKRVGYRIPSN